MRASQIIGLIVAFLLLFPGLCFFGLGSGVFLDAMNARANYLGSALSGLVLAGVGVAVFVAIWFLVRYAFRKPPP